MAADSEGRLRRFAKVSSDCVFQAAQNLGIQASTEVSNALVDDVSFRIRHITDTACQFMHHAKRKRLTTDDFDKALKWSRTEPLHGHQTGQASQFTPTQNTNVFIVPDHELDLSSAALETSVDKDSLPSAPHVEASWVAVEGATVNQTSNEGDQSYIELKRDSNEPNERYLSVLMEAVTGDKEDLRMVALTDVQKNTAITNILPDIIIYLQETLYDWLQFTPKQLTHLLKLSLALFQNPHLFLEPYLPAIYPSFKAMILDSSYLLSTEEGDHWRVRELVATALATLLQRCGPLTESLSDLHSSLHHLLSSSNPPLPSLYGAVLTLCYLSGESLVTVLYPHMESLVTVLSGLLEGRLPTPIKEDVLRVYETLVLGAELLLIGGYQLEDPPASPTPPAPPEPKPTQPSLSREPGSLFANTSFGLSSESADMEIEHTSPQTDSNKLTGKNEEKPPSLYDKLTEMFGESLLLRLSTHPQFTPTHTPHAPHTHKNTVTDIVHKKSSQTSPELQTFLSEEGFKPLKVELPLASLPRPPRRGRWTLVVPKTKLPVGGNVLEQKSKEARHHSRRGKEKRQAPSGAVSKGVCASYRRHNSRSGLETVGVQSAWL